MFKHVQSINRRSCRPLVFCVKYFWPRRYQVLFLVIKDCHVRKEGREEVLIWVESCHGCFWRGKKDGTIICIISLDTSLPNEFDLQISKNLINQLYIFHLFLSSFSSVLDSFLVCILPI